MNTSVACRRYLCLVLELALLTAVSGCTLLLPLQDVSGDEADDTAASGFGGGPGVTLGDGASGDLDGRASDTDLTGSPTDNGSQTSVDPYSDTEEEDDEGEEDDEDEDDEDEEDDDYDDPGAMTADIVCSAIADCLNVDFDVDDCIDEFEAIEEVNEARAQEILVSCDSCLLNLSCSESVGCGYECAELM